MKAMTTLENSYCVPRTEEEFKSLHFYSGIEYKGSRPVITSEGDSYCYIAYLGTGDRTEISVFHFRDLIHDRIAPWRLEECGGVQEDDCDVWFIECGKKLCVGFYIDGYVSVSINYDYASIPVYITTFTELLTLIKFLTPPANNA